MSKAKKIISRIVLAVLSLILAGLAFLFFTDGYNMYMVRSESMVPAINMGDLIITGPVDGPINGEVKAGTIVTFLHNKQLVTHRVESVNGEALVTRVMQLRSLTLGRLRCPMCRAPTCSGFPMSAF